MSSTANRVVEMAQGLRRAESTGIAPYVTAGDGGLARTRRVLERLEEAGAACCELGVPFSDPIADGPVLQRAAERSLRAGTTVRGVLSAAAQFRAEGGTLPILLFTYLNPLVGSGLLMRLAEVRASGIDGLLVPDLPVEEAEPLARAAGAAGLTLPLFAAPTTDAERLERTVAHATGFLYVVGRVGVTGARTDIGSAQAAGIDRIRAAAGDLPLGVGFGIAERPQVAALEGRADLAISGTAFVRAIHGAGDPDDEAAAERAARLVTELKGSAAPITPGAAPPGHDSVP